MEWHSLDDLSWTVFYERVIAGNFSRINHFAKMHAIIEWCCTLTQIDRQTRTHTDTECPTE